MTPCTASWGSSDLPMRKKLHGETQRARSSSNGIGGAAMTFDELSLHSRLLRKASRDEVALLNASFPRAEGDSRRFSAALRRVAPCLVYRTDQHSIVRLPLVIG